MAGYIGNRPSKDNIGVFTPNQQFNLARRGVWNLFIPDSFDPNNKESNVILSNNNYQWKSNDPDAFGLCYSVSSQSSGKYYIEIEVIDATGYPGFGVTGNTSLDVETDDHTNNASGFYVQPGSSIIISNINDSRTTLSGLPNVTDGDIVMMAVDVDNKEMWFGVNGTWNNSTPGGGTGDFTSADMPSTPYYLIAGDNYTSGTEAEVLVNFGQKSATYNVPSGFTVGWPAN